MNRAVLRTLAYSDIFDYPLRADEIWEWQIADRERNVISKEEVKKILAKLESLGYCQEKNGYYYLKGRDKIVKTREQRKEFSKLKLNRARKITKILSFIPWVKLIGITGSLARENAGREDDIDLFVITSRNRLWLTRGLISFVLRITKLYRRPLDAANKFCPNLFVMEDDLRIEPQDLFTAHEVCSMKPIFIRRETYFRFIRVNSWVKRFLPNAITALPEPPDFIGVVKAKPDTRRYPAKQGFKLPWIGPKKAKRLKAYERKPWTFSPGKLIKIVMSGEKEKHRISRLDLLRVLEKLAWRAQLKYMDSRRTSETVTENLIKFHPQDVRKKILIAYQNRLMKIDSLLF